MEASTPSGPVPGESPKIHDGLHTLTQSFSPKVKTYLLQAPSSKRPLMNIDVGSG